MPEETTVTPAVVEEEVVKTDKELIAEEEEEKQAAEKEKEITQESTEETEKPKKEKKAKVPFVFTKDWEEGKVYLYQSNRTPVVPSLFPKELLLETWLKLHGVPYENVSITARNSARKERLPFVELNGEKIAGGDVLPRLAERFEKNVSGHLSQEQLNIEHAVVKMVENHLYWYVMDWRTKCEDNTVKAYKLNLPAYFQSSLPPAVLSLHFKLSVCKKVQKQKRGQGFTNLEELAKQDLKVLSEMLAEQDFMFGSQVSMLDLVVFSILSLVLMVDPEYECEMRDWVVENLTNLVDLVSRLKEKVWGDHWDSATGDSLDLNPHIPKPEPEPEAENQEDEKKDEEKVDEEKGEDAKDGEKEEVENTDEESKEESTVEKRNSILVSLKNIKTRVFTRTKKEEAPETVEKSDEEEVEEKEGEKTEKVDEETDAVETEKEQTDEEKAEEEKPGKRLEKRNSIIGSIRNMKSRIASRSKKEEVPEPKEKPEDVKEEVQDGAKSDEGKTDEEKTEEEKVNEETTDVEKSEKKNSILDSLKNIKSRVIPKSKKEEVPASDEKPEVVEGEEEKTTENVDEEKKDNDKADDEQTDAGKSEKKNSLINSLKNIKSRVVAKSKKAEAPEPTETSDAVEEVKEEKKEEEVKEEEKKEEEKKEEEVKEEEKKE